MNAFEYASPSTKKNAVELLSEKPDKTVVLAGGTDLLSLMKDNVAAPERVVSIKSIGDLGGISYDGNHGFAHRRAGHVGRARSELEGARRLPVAGSGGRRNPKPTTAEHGHGGR